MILLIEPVSKNTDMYVPAYPLPIMEIAGFVKSHIPEIDIEVISIPMDYGLPLNKSGREKVYGELIREFIEIRPKGVGISCTAIDQAGETIHLCERIKETDPDIFIFLGGYFPTIYHEEILSRTSAVDLIVIGEGEIPSLKIIENLEKGKDPRREDIPNLAWTMDGQVYKTRREWGFDLNGKAILNLGLLRHPKAYDILPYSFSRGCPFHCNFCMEDLIRPVRKEVPSEIIQRDLVNLSNQCNTRNLLISDALFRSFDLFPALRSLGFQVNFETRCDVFDPSLIQDIADVIGMLALGFESASYDTLKRMNKVKDRAHYQKYISNAEAIFRAAVRNDIPVMVFMIAGYPGDTVGDLEMSLAFSKKLAQESGTGGHVFKIGECRAYPKTKIYDFAVSSPDVVFDDDGVFGQNIIRQASKELHFETTLAYMKEIFGLSHYTDKLKSTLHEFMPFFRLPSQALTDEMIPDSCYMDNKRDIFKVHGENLDVFRGLLSEISEKYKEGLSKERSERILKF